MENLPNSVSDLIVKATVYIQGKEIKIFHIFFIDFRTKKSANNRAFKMFIRAMQNAAGGSILMLF